MPGIQTLIFTCFPPLRAMLHCKVRGLQMNRTEFRELM